jgi:hypothetical protein
LANFWKVINTVVCSFYTLEVGTLVGVFFRPHELMVEDGLLQSEYTHSRLADTQQVHMASDGKYATEAERRLAENQAALRGGERSGLLRKKPMSTMTKINIMLCGQEGCDWKLTGILCSIFVLGGLMAGLAAFGQFANWNMMGHVSKAWAADGDNDVFTNGYSATPRGDPNLPSASGGAGGSSPGANVFGAAEHSNDKQKAPPGDTFASSTVDSVRDALGLGANGPPSWARVEGKKQTSPQTQLAREQKTATTVHALHRTMAIARAQARMKHAASGSKPSQ